MTLHYCNVTLRVAYIHVSPRSHRRCEAPTVIVSEAIKTLTTACDRYYITFPLSESANKDGPERLAGGGILSNPREETPAVDGARKSKMGAHGLDLGRAEGATKADGSAPR